MFFWKSFVSWTLVKFLLLVKNFFINVPSIGSIWICSRLFFSKLILTNNFINLLFKFSLLRSLWCNRAPCCKESWSSSFINIWSSRSIILKVNFFFVILWRSICNSFNEVFVLSLFFFNKLLLKQVLSFIYSWILTSKEGDFLFLKINYQKQIKQEILKFVWKLYAFLNISKTNLVFVIFFHS